MSSGGGGKKKVDTTAEAKKVEEANQAAQDIAAQGTVAKNYVSTEGTGIEEGGSILTTGKGIYDTAIYKKQKLG